MSRWPLRTAPLARARWQSDTGSAIVEFVLVGVLLTVLTLSVIQLGLTLLIRNTLQDAASEGARYAALADNTAHDGVERTRQLVTAAIGSTYDKNVTIATGTFDGHPAYTVTVVAPLPVMGLIGLPRGLEVHGHAAIETLP